jgi:hypothetical protein
MSSCLLEALFQHRGVVIPNLRDRSVAFPVEGAQHQLRLLTDHLLAFLRTTADGPCRVVRISRDRDHPFRRIVITRFAAS